MADSKSGGIGVGFILFLVFLVLKLCGVITWSWLWVTCPLWGAFALGLGILLLGVICAVIAAAVSGGR